MNGDYIFFLGGHDLEMLTIKKILDDKKQKYFDNGLSWRAKASSYKQEIENLRPDEIPVFIELEIDINIPSNSIIIDHHNERAGKDAKTSIEQIADLLNIELNRWQKLVSVNDKAYIWGMIEIGANDEEIQCIRNEDRRAQGVSEKDEQLAKFSIQHLLTEIDHNTVIIESLTSKTSAIVDQLYKYYQHVFIITPDHELNYYGSGEIIEMLIKYYNELKKNNNDIRYWYGGSLPAHGYFGSNKKLSKEEITMIVKPFLVKEKIYSQHIFLFPFTIENKELKEIKSSRNRLEKIYQQLKENGEWKYKPFPLFIDCSVSEDRRLNEKIWAYNEYYYFHEYVRKTLFNGLNEKELFKKESQPISLYYERELSRNDEMIIFIRVKDKIRIFTLKIDHLSLRIFETGIGILTITLYNYCYFDFDDILLINDFGRRIYPQFLGGSNINYDLADSTKNTFLADKIIFRINDKNIEDNFYHSKYFNPDNRFANYLEELLKPLIDTKEGIWKIVPIIDDRMFTICWHINDHLMNQLQKYNDKTNAYNYENDIRWYKFIYVDGKDNGVGNIKMKKELINQATYHRFIDKGVLYGISRYSFVCLCNDSWFSYNVIRNHMQKVYYQMIILLLAQRASIIKFNNELEIISADADKLFNEDVKEETSRTKNEFEPILTKSEQLYKDIILLSNRIIFEEVTPQEQGIELYKIALQNMDINNQYNSLKIKVNHLYDFINIKLERQRSENLHKLTFLSIIFAIVVSIIGVWAIDFNFLDYWKGKTKYPPSLLTTILVFVLSILFIGTLIFMLINAKLKIINKKTERKIWIILILTSILWFKIII